MFFSTSILTNTHVSFLKVKLLYDAVCRRLVGLSVIISLRGGKFHFHTHFGALVFVKRNALKSNYLLIFQYHLNFKLIHWNMLLPDNFMFLITKSVQESYLRSNTEIGNCHDFLFVSISRFNHDFLQDDFDSDFDDDSASQVGSQVS